ncbi:MAG: GNAT family N-acetyltransferase [Candidatus Sericytochromatia bacterium]
MPIPYRIETPRLVLRCYQPADAGLLKEAIDASLAHLQAWMPWARQEPSPLEAKIERLRRMRGEFDLDRDYTFGIFDPGETGLLGSTGLHTRLGPRELEIGYWVHVDHCGQGYAGEAAAALTHVAFVWMEVQHVEIRCDPANLASQAVPRRLGYRHENTLKGKELTPDGHPRDTMVWVMYREDFENSGLAQQKLRLFDATGARLQS